MADIYRIRVQGHLDDRWSDWLDGMTVQRHDGGVTELTGPIVDQAALHGLLARIRDLGLPLLSMCRDDELHDDTDREPPIGGERPMRTRID